MRREQVHKICLNHWLTQDISYTPKDDDKTWLFSAADFSEGEVDFQVFCVRFKTPDVAMEFKKAVDSARAGISVTESETDISSENEVIYVSETQVSKEEEEEAVRLGLPPKFMAYRRLPDCVCEQCKREDAMSVDSSSSSLKGLLLKPSKLATVAPVSAAAASPMQGIFSKPAQNVFTANTSSSVLPQGLFGSMAFGASSFGNANSTSSSQSFFGNTSSPAPVASVFGNTAAAAAASVQSVFTATPPTTKAKSLFESPSTIKESLISTSAVATPPTIKARTLFESPSTTKESLISSYAVATTATTKVKTLFESPSTIKTSLLSSSAVATPPTTKTKTLFESPSTIKASLMSSSAVASPPTTKAKNRFESPSTIKESSISSSAVAKPPTTKAKTLFQSPTTINESLISSTAVATPPTTNAKNRFEAPSTIKASLISSSAVATPPTNETKNRFDSPSTIKESLFSSLAVTTNAKNLFESPSTIKESSISSSGVATPPTTKAKTLFESPSTIKESLFSSPAGNNKSLFSTPVASGGSLFGSGATPSLFGNKATVTFGTKNDSNTTSKLFGTGASLFGGTPVTSSHVFGNSAASSVSSDASIFSTATTTTVSSLFGGGATDKNLFIGEKLDGGYRTFSEVKENPFASLGAGSAVFASKPRKSSPTKGAHNSSEAAATADESGANEDSYDPHYEPIVPLPDEIVLRTGEEDEQVLFNERGKLYRYNDNEWKERGVGQIKILHDPVKGTYRMLLRRDQVHKIVLNQRITSNLDVKRLTVTPNTWMWAGHNCCEDKHELEKLAVRFKLDKTYNSFKQVVDNAIADLKETESVPGVPAHFGESSRVFVTEVSSTNATRYESDIEDGYDHEDDDDDDYDRTVSFAKVCAVSALLVDGDWQEIATHAEMQILYDPDAYGSRVVVCDPSGYIISNTIIGKNSNMIRSPDDDGYECEWRAVEYADDYYDWKTLKVTFDDVNDAQECHLAYLEGVSFAEQADIIDDIPHHIYETDEHYE